MITLDWEFSSGRFYMASKKPAARRAAGSKNSQKLPESLKLELRRCDKNLAKDRQASLRNLKKTGFFGILKKIYYDFAIET